MMCNQIIVKHVKLSVLYIWFLFLLGYGLVCFVHFSGNFLLKIAGFIFFCVYLLYLAYKSSLFGNYQDYVTQAILLNGTSWLLIEKSGKILNYILAADSFRSKHWIILRFKGNNYKLRNTKKIMILNKHTQPQTTWRHLQVYLRYVHKVDLL